MNVYDLFAVKVIHDNFIVDEKLHQKIKDFVSTGTGETNKYSNRKGLQVHNNFEGKQELNDDLNQMFSKFYNLQIGYSWLNIVDQNAYNLPHWHRGTELKLSANLYLSESNGPITFTRNGDFFEITPKLFDLIIFPTHLVHYVLPSEKNNSRITYAMDLKDVKN